MCGLCWRAVTRFVLLLGVVSLGVSLSVAAQQNSLVGTWNFVRDSDGSTADEGTSVTLTFSVSGVAFTAIGPGQSIADSGTYSTSGSRITLSLPHIGKSASNQPYTLSGPTLVLPFKVFSDGAGSSTWLRVTAQQGRDGSSGGGGSGSGGSGSGGVGGGGRSSGSSGGGSNAGGGSGSKGGAGGSGGGHGGSGGGSGGGGGHGGGFAGGGSSSGSGGQAPLAARDPKYAKLVGVWTGEGSSYEVRFRAKGRMSVAVLHSTVFVLYVEPDGSVVGQGTVVYNVDPNLCGIAKLAQQVNEAIDMMDWVLTAYGWGEKAGKVYKEFVEILTQKAGEVAKSATGAVAKIYLKAAASAGYKVAKEEISEWWKQPLKKIGEEIRDREREGQKADKGKEGCKDSGRSVGGFEPGMMPGIMNVPGVTKVQYEYKGLEKGPEVRLIYIRGRVEPSGDGYRMYLEQDGEVMEGDKQLWISYMVNYQRERKPFPCWSPFLKGPGRILLVGKNGRPTVRFEETGTHRNGFQPWEEYKYAWSAELMPEPRTGSNP